MERMSEKRVPRVRLSLVAIGLTCSVHAQRAQGVLVWTL